MRYLGRARISILALAIFALPILSGCSGVSGPAAAPPTKAPSTGPAPTSVPATSAPAAATGKPGGEAAKPAGKPASSGEWDQVLAAANKEGKVVVAGPPGTGYREAMRVFEQKYPDIKLQFEGLAPNVFQTRLDSERTAGQYLWDVFITGAGTYDVSMKKAGTLASVRAAMLLPEVLDEKAWLGGFKKAFLDSEGQYIFAFQAETEAEAYVNRDFVKESDLSSIKGMLDPKWKGKIAMYDPRTDGAGNGRTAFWLGLLGEDFLRSLLKQDLVLSRDDRQLVDWAVRGQYPVAIALSQTELFNFQKEGAGKNVVPLHTQNEPEAWRLSTGWGGLRLISKPPNPNAAKVFVNWLLSKEGQTAWVEKAGRASRRLDVPKIGGLSPDPAIDYYDIDREDTMQLRDQAKQIATEMLK